MLKCVCLSLGYVQKVEKIFWFVKTKKTTKQKRGKIIKLLRKTFIGTLI